MSPASTSAFISYKRWSSWVFVFNYNPEETSADRFDEQYCQHLVDQAIGKAVPYNSPLYPNTFLLGNATYLFPPTGGLGVNTRIANAHNLIWKLHAVCLGQADAGLLKTYGSERRPVAVANAMQSTRNQQALMQLFRASRHLDPARPQ
ncbi:FAD binding domain-containing protein [Aspergillus heterothallicus]